ncbi:MAG: hypothetical protein J6M21_02465 [Campylobacter sp.]|nr:hypothetical protein [Campylobacter sp.]
MTQKQKEFENFRNDFDRFKQAIDEFDISNLDQNMRDEFLEVQNINLYVDELLKLVNIDLMPQEFISGRPSQNLISSVILRLKNKQSNWLSEIKNIANTYLKQISLYSSTKIPKNQISAIIPMIIKNYENAISQSVKNIEAKDLKLSEKIEEFDKFDKEQREKIVDLKNRATKLFEHLTDANLASKFQNEQINLTKDINKWDIIFIITLSCFVAFAIFSFFSMKEMANYKDILTQLLINMSVYIPLSWLALFASRRRNEDKKLQEEYRYKETIATNYLNYKKNIIEDMPEEQQNELLKELMQNLLDMLKDNPNNKFANKHNNENIPIIEFIDKISKMPSDNIEKILNFLKGTK